MNYYPTGVKCRQCGEEIREPEFQAKGGWPLHEDDKKYHFCSDECSEQHKLKSIRPTYVMKGSVQEAILKGMANGKKGETEDDPV